MSKVKDIKDLVTCGWCYKWLGAWHRVEDCPRTQPKEET